MVALRDGELRGAVVHQEKAAGPAERPGRQVQVAIAIHVAGRQPFEAAARVLALLHKLFGEDAFTDVEEPYGLLTVTTTRERIHDIIAGLRTEQVVARSTHQHVIALRSRRR